jgi:hypothetical protein
MYSLNVLVLEPLELTTFVTVAVDRMTYGFCVVDTLAACIFYNCRRQSYWSGYRAGVRAVRSVIADCTGDVLGV